MARLVNKYVVWLGIAAVSIITISSASGEDGFSGRWQLKPEASSAVDPWRRIIADIDSSGNRLVIRERVTTGRRSHDATYSVDLSKESNGVSIDWWTGNRHIGAFLPEGEEMRVAGEWLDDGRTLKLESRYTLATSQGEAPVRDYAEYRLSDDGSTLTRITLRSTRPLPILHVFERQ